MVFDFCNLFNNKKKLKDSCSCDCLFSSLFFDSDNNVKFCPKTSDYNVISDFNGIWLDIDKIKDSREKFINSFTSNKLKNICSECEYLNYENNSYSLPLRSLHIGHWRFCYINCIYCNVPKQENLIEAKHYDIYPVVKQLIDAKFIDTKTKIIIDCGDATVHPEFDKLMYFFINYQMTNVVINTSALRYCESISEAIAKNIGTVIVSLDSGCAYIYGEVKSLNKFDIAISNIKRYLEFQEPSQKRVVLKYVILKGVNDNQKEILDWFILARDLGIKKLAFDIDEVWFNEIKYSIPNYLKEIISFVNNMSDYNNIEIEFYDRVKMLYNSINQNKQ